MNTIIKRIAHCNKTRTYDKHQSRVSFISCYGSGGIKNDTRPWKCLEML
jgi:hypothetical protein